VKVSLKFRFFLTDKILPNIFSQSRFWSRREGLSHLATFSREDLWKTNLAKYDNVVVFGGGDLVRSINLPKTNLEVFFR